MLDVLGGLGVWNGNMIGFSLGDSIITWLGNMCLYVNIKDQNQFEKWDKGRSYTKINLENLDETRKPCTTRLWLHLDLKITYKS